MKDHIVGRLTRLYWAPVEFQKLGFLKPPTAPQRTFLAVEYFKKVGTYGRDDFNTQYPGAVPPSRKTIW